MALRREVAPYASVVARVGERERWIVCMQKDIDWMCDSFALRPPHGARRQTAALHWTSRLGAMDAGPAEACAAELQRADGMSHCLLVMPPVKARVDYLQHAAG